MKNIEVEIRSFITKSQSDRLLKFFKNNAKLLMKDNQKTYYFDCKEDLRIQKNNHFSKIWFKKGKIHDNHREEIEIRFPRNDFEKLENLFLTLGHKVKIKWFRKRNEFRWKGVNVCLDFTKGYGYIIELEKMANPQTKKEVLSDLQKKMKSLGIQLTPRAEFEKKFRYYEKNWQRLI